ncbi:PASTA domain-containing protein [Propionicimonas sp.]|uniref:PASTA domain-containing protein n=1 Tax=Propionicimonas sp. TaxID=1955623 RepID=UPI003D0E9776
MSKGPAPIEIVSYKNRPFDEAKAYYESAGLVVNRAEDKYSSTVDAGNVISSDPKVGESVEKGGTITFTVSKGPEMVTVPGVRGLSEDQATKKLKDAGFKVTVRKTFFGSTAWGTDPGEGQQAPKGSTITLILV